MLGLALERMIALMKEDVIPLFLPTAEALIENKTWYSWLLRPKSILKSNKESVCRQLETRKMPHPYIWGTDPLRIRIGQILSKVAQEAYHWPNDYFVPNDPFEIVYLMPWDEIEIKNISQRLEHELNIKLKISDLYELQGKTLSQFLDFLIR